MQTVESLPASWWREVIIAVLKQPGLWITALTMVFRLATPGWWRRAPFLPLPDEAYLRFRLETQYGSSGTAEPDDVITYLRWCRSARPSV